MQPKEKEQERGKNVEGAFKTIFPDRDHKRAGGSRHATEKSRENGKKDTPLKGNIVASKNKIKPYKSSPYGNLLETSPRYYWWSRYYPWPFRKKKKNQGGSAQ